MKNNYKKLFRSKKRFSSLVSEISNILESEKTDTEKLSEITSMIDVASESTCYVCLLDSEEEHPSKTKGLCQKHYDQYKNNQYKSKKYHKEPYNRNYLGENRIYGPIPLPVSKLNPDICAAEGCEEKRQALGYCSLHYSRVFLSRVNPNDTEAMNKPNRLKRY
ncbi:hypothetical protein ABHN05_13030 [Brevibacillus laterosporus]|uniref:hypothetical protein n=1 Tax=Brevibacillus laterosporus TaxID=1465 RepID=UPI00112EBD7E|nr:hypothetical protein [Brevibacillus laterosporus]MBG9804879.1 hypothetical protein [Brevibacillus laterosporus]MED4762117.1 hypothetical protein [Brevibacillus laterosporus]TPH09976.1 hypothetical protein EGH09_21720 [Brevibacillus laterosporus]